MIIRKNEKGLTLVEVLAVIVISTMILTFMYMLLSQGMSQFTQKSQVNAELQDAAYALKVITEDLRRTPLNGGGINTIVINESTLHANNNTYSYNGSNQEIELNNKPFVTNIKEFSVSVTATTGVDITIETIHEKKYSTIIILR